MRFDLTQTFSHVDPVSIWSIWQPRQGLLHPSIYPSWMLTFDSYKFWYRLTQLLSSWYFVTCLSSLYLKAHLRQVICIFCDRNHLILKQRIQLRLNLTYIVVSQCFQ